MRGRGLTLWLATWALVLALAAPASAEQRLISFKAQSRFVDPSDPQVRFNGVDPKLRVNVLLPDGYDGRKRFPVLYLLHGHGDAYDDWADPDHGDIREVAKDFPGIVVMPDGDRGWYVNWWNGGDRESPAWERYHLGELIAVAERRLRIRPGRRWHAIAGLSMGGEGAIFYASQRPGYFGSAASFSGPLSIQRPEWPQAFDTQGESHQEVFGDPQAQRFNWTGHNPTALVGNLRHTRLFVAVGDGTPNPQRPEEVRNVTGQLAERELRQHSEDFVDSAQDADVEVTYDPHQGIHDWPYWRRDLAAAIEWGFFRRVADEPERWTYTTVGARGRMWGLRFRFEDPPDEVVTFTREGARLSADASGKVTIRSPGGEVLREKLPFSHRLPDDFFD